MVFGLESYIENHYARALILLFLVFVVLKISVFIIERIIVRFTKKTSTTIDDIILNKTSRPVTLLILILGIRLALGELPYFTSNIDSLMWKITYSIIIVITGYILFVILDQIIARGWKKFAIKTKSRVDESLISIFHSILNVTWVLIVFLYLLSSWGVQIGPFLAGLGIAGLAVALALQPTLSNIFSGISIVMDKTVRVGDLVYLDAETKGKILKIGLRSTRIQTFDNELIIIPNSKLADSMIQNVALPEPKSRAVVPFSVSYGNDIDKVKKIILKEIKTLSNVEKDPEPVVRFVEMANSSLNFKAYYFVDSFENRFASIDEANTKIYNALNKNGISIPFPQMDVHVKKD